MTLRLTKSRIQWLSDQEYTGLVSQTFSSKFQHWMQLHEIQIYLSLLDMRKVKKVKKTWVWIKAGSQLMHEVKHKHFFFFSRVSG